MANGKTIQTTPTLPLSALATDYNKWAKEHPELTTDELIDTYAIIVQLSPKRTQALKDEITPLATDSIIRQDSTMTPVSEFQRQALQAQITILKQYLPRTQKEIDRINKILTGETEPAPTTAAPKPAATAPKPAAPAPKPATPAPVQPTPEPTPTKPPAPKAPATKPATPAPTVPKETIIARTKFPKWWNDEGTANISLTSPGSQFVITARADYQLYIATIVLTVSGACTIIFSFGQYGASGAMMFGGDQEPRGIVIAMGNSPAPCGTGSFMVTASSPTSVDIGGFVSYFLWKKEPQ